MRRHDKYIFIMNDKTVDADELVLGVKTPQKISLPCCFYNNCSFISKYWVNLWLQQMHQTAIENENFNSACWVILQAFLSSTDFFLKKSTFLTNKLFK